MAWDRLRRIAAPAVPPVTLEEAKAHLRVTSDTEDALIEHLIEAATGTIEGPHGAGLALITQTWTLALDYFPVIIVLPIGPVQAVSEIKYLDPTGAEKVINPAQYVVSTQRSPAIIMPATGFAWPATAHMVPDVVTVTFTAGYGDAPADVPAELRAAILLMVGHLYENREAVGSPLVELPLGYSALVDRYRVGRFG